eukprot:ANDGO_01797.mRNA.1 Flagellar radial spoke protein 1
MSDPAPEENVEPVAVAEEEYNEEADLPAAWQLATEKRYSALYALIKKDPSVISVKNPRNGDVLISWAVRNAPVETNLVDLIMKKKGRDAFCLKEKELAVLDAYGSFKLPEYEAPEDNPEAPDTRDFTAEFVKAQLAVEGQTLKEWDIQRIVNLGVWSDNPRVKDRRALYVGGDLFCGEVQHDEETGVVKMDGRGLYVFKEVQSKYLGRYKNGKKHGHGILWYKDGSRYEGTFADDELHGIGIYYYANGDVYRGKFAKGCKDGKGEYIYAQDRATITWSKWNSVDPFADEKQPYVELPTIGKFHGQPFPTKGGTFMLKNGMSISGFYDASGRWVMQDVSEGEFVDFGALVGVAQSQ